MHRILLVEDDLEMVELVRQILSDDAAVDTAYLRNDVKNLLGGDPYDLFIVDLGLPDSHGYDIFSMIRSDHRHQHAPIVFLTADDSDQSQVTSFGIGADDYITKPIRATAFRARIISRLKAAKDQVSLPRSYGCLVIDPVGMQAWVDLRADARKLLELTPLEFRILNVLARRKEEVVDRQTLIREAWGRNTHVTNRVVDQHVSSLRRQFPPGTECIQTIYGIGYKFIPPRAGIVAAERRNGA